MIRGVLASDIDSVWDRVKPEVTRALVRFDPGFDEEHVRQRLKKRELQLWLCNGFDGICISEIIIHPQFKVLSFPVVAGENIDDWLLPMMEVGEAFGRHHNCKYIEGYGRKGWLRKLKPYGWNDHSITTRKEL